MVKVQGLQLTDVAEVVETTGADSINHVDLERFRNFNRQRGKGSTSGGVN